MEQLEFDLGKIGLDTKYITKLDFRDLLDMDDQSIVRIDFGGLHNGYYMIAIVTQKGYAQGRGESLYDAWSNAMQAIRNARNEPTSHHEHLGLA